MGTEEDTFNKLRRIPLNEMVDKVFRNCNEEEDDVDAYLRIYGWTLEEYNSEILKYLSDHIGVNRDA